MTQEHKETATGTTNTGRAGGRLEGSTSCRDCNTEWKYTNRHEYEIAVDALWSHACQ